MKAKTCSL